MNLPHSPAPWILIRDMTGIRIPDLLCYIDSRDPKDGSPHTLALIPKFRLEEEEILANAKLMEAAVDMYRMLKKVVASGYLDAEIIYLLNRLEENKNHEQENREGA